MIYQLTIGGLQWFPSPAPVCFLTDCAYVIDPLSTFCHTRRAMLRHLTGIIAIAALLCAGSAWAATLSGTVHDPSGAAAFNAQISAKNEATAEVHRTRDDDDGG